MKELKDQIKQMKVTEEEIHLSQTHLRKHNEDLKDTMIEMEQRNKVVAN